MLRRGWTGKRPRTDRSGGAEKRDYCAVLLAEDAGVDEALLGDVPAVLRGGSRERGELGTDLGAVTGRGKNPDLLGERLGVGLQATGLAVGEVPHVRVLATVE